MRKCLLCPAITSSIEEHHLSPLSYGGKRKGETVLICANCHTEIHKCIEDPTRFIPPWLFAAVMKGRKAKDDFLAGKTVALDRRPSVAILLSNEDERVLAYLSKLFNTKSKSETLLKSMRYAALHASREARRRKAGV